MKKIQLRGLQEVLSERELKNVFGGSGVYSCNCTLPSGFKGVRISVPSGTECSTLYTCI